MRKRLKIKREEPEVVTDSAGREYNAKTGKKIVRVYPDQKCKVQGCKKKAVGEGDVCEDHGGSSLIRSNLLLEREIPDAIRGKYKKEYPSLYVELAREGKSEVEIAAQIGVSVMTLRNWAEKFFEFHEAMEVGKALHESWWMGEGKENLSNRNYNTTLYKFLTGNKLGWSDKIESKNMNVHAGVLLVPGQMTEDDWKNATNQRTKEEEDVQDI